MKNLRQKLMAISSGKPSAPRPDPSMELFCREHIVPLERLGGIEQVKLEDVCACDPLFTGDSWNMNRLLFLDTETTGLSGGAGTVAFEIGVGWIEPRGMVIRQYVMRNYAQEAAMLSEIAKLFERTDIVITFNGKSFDLPLLESRMVMNRIRLHVTDYPHLDLLHAARRVYKLRLGRCNLTSLEEAVLGKVRDDDLPGAQVPQRYFDYLKTGDFSLLEDVLQHNFEDVQSLAELTANLCGVYREPEKLKYAQDLYGVSRTLMRGGDTHRARSCFKILGRSTLSSQAHMHLAISYKKSREWDELQSSCLDMIARGEGGTWPYIELAKFFEHVAHDNERALRYAKSALITALNIEPLHGEQTDTAPIMRRIERLQRKTEGAYQI